MSVLASMCSLTTVYVNSMALANYLWSTLGTGPSAAVLSTICINENTQNKIQAVTDLYI